MVSYPNVVLSKTSLSEEVRPGDSVVYELSYSNTGEGPALDLELEDVLPSLLRYVSADPPPSVVDDQRLVWSIGELAAGTSGVISLTTEVVEDATGDESVANQVLARMSNPPSPSERPVMAVDSLYIMEPIFTWDGVYTQSAELIAGEYIHMHVQDLDQNISDDVIDSVLVTMANETDNDIEIVYLRETGSATGEFTGSIATRDERPTSENGFTVISSAKRMVGSSITSRFAPSQGDGLLSMDEGDLVKGSYYDEINTGRLPRTITAETSVRRTLIRIEATPSIIVANGSDTSIIQAQVTDDLGRELGDGYPVAFTANLGQFEDGSQLSIVETSGGEGYAQITYVAPILAAEQITQVYAEFGGNKSKPIQLQVMPGAAAIRVYDQVRDVEVTSGDPSLHVSVLLIGTTVEGDPYEAEVEIDENGLYLIPKIPPGNYELLSTIIEKETGRVILDGKLQDIDVQLDGSVTPPANTIVGSLRGKDNTPGSRYAGTLVELIDELGTVVASVVASPDGDYEFNGLTPGRYTLRATLPDGKIATAEVASLSEDSGSVVVNALILIDPFGIVYEADTGEAVQGATVALRYLDGTVLPIPLLDGIGASPNINNINPFISTDIGGYAFLFGGDQVGSIDLAVEYTMTVEMPIGSEYLDRIFLLRVQPTTPGPVQEAIIGMWAYSQDGMQMAEANDVALIDEPIFVPDIETIAFNIPVFAQRPDLRFEFDIVDDELAIGDETLLRYTVRNEGDGVAKQISIIDTLSSAWQVVDTGLFRSEAGVLTYELDGLEPGAEVLLEVSVRLVRKPTEGDQVAERAWFGGVSLPSSENLQTVKVLVPTWRLENRASVELAAPGQEFNYTLTYYNDGNAVGRGAALIDTFSADLEVIEAVGATVVGGVVVWQLPDLAPGSADSVQVRVRLRDDIATGASVANIAHLTHDSGDGTGELVRFASMANELLTRPPDVDLRLTVSPTVISIGDQATISVYIRDNDKREGVWTVRDTLSGGLVYVEGSSTRPVNYDPSSGMIEWQIESSEGAAEWTYQIEPRADLSPGTHPMQSRVQAVLGNVVVRSELVQFTAVVAYFEISVAIDQPTIELGDFVRYDLNLANMSSHDSLSAVLVRMQIPEGFKYVNGTSIFENEKVTTLEESNYRIAPRAKRSTAAVQIDSMQLPSLLNEGINIELNPQKQLLEWFLPGIAPGDSRQLSFSAVAGAGAENSSGKAQAAGVALTTTSLISLASNVTRINVRVSPSATFSLGQLTIGRAWVDEDGDGAVDAGEPPVPGIVLTMENGTRIVADSDGRFSIPEVERGDHVLHLSPDHIPAHLEPVALSTRAAADPWTRFVHFGLAGMAKVNVPFRQLDQGYLDQRLYAIEHWWLDRTVRHIPTWPIAPLHFATGSTDLEGDRLIELANLAQLLRAAPGLQWEVGGHTDNRSISTEEFSSNEKLSLERAQSVAEWLVAAGVDQAQLNVLSYGDQHPVADHSTATGRQQNRRVELKPLWPHERTVPFSSGRTKLQTESPNILSSLQALSAQLQAVPSLNLELEGHADTQRLVSDAFSDNDALALVRAQVVADWLIADGVASLQLKVTSKGAWDPVADNRTESGRSKNRRVEAKFILPQLYQIQLQSRWDGAEAVEITQVVQGAYPEAVALMLAGNEQQEAYVTAQGLGIDNMGAPQSLQVQWETLGVASAMDVWGTTRHSSMAIARSRTDVPIEDRWAPAPYRAPWHWWLERSVQTMQVWPTEPLYFAPGSADIRREDTLRLDELANYLGAVPGMRVLIEGHADAKPIINQSYRNNQELSIERGASVARRLMQDGIAKDRIEIVAHAERYPLGDNTTETGRSKNRRVQISMKWPDEQTVYFGSGVAVLDSVAKQVLDNIASTLLSTPALGLVIEGHTDAQRLIRSSFDDNATLALARAQIVADRLVASGINRSQLNLVSKGDREPIADNTTDHGRRHNRRVELEFVSPQVHKLQFETYTPTDLSPISLVQRINGVYPAIIERTMRVGDSKLTHVAGIMSGVADLDPPSTQELQWQLLDRTQVSDRWVAGYVAADTSASGQGVVARVGSRWAWELKAQNVRSSQVQWNATLGVESDLSPAPWRIDKGDTLRQHAIVHIAERVAGQETLIAALRSESAQSLLLADTLTVPVDAEPWWQHSISEQTDTSGVTTRTIELVYRGLKSLPLVHSSEVWSEQIAVERGDPSLLFRDDRVVKIWRDIEPGARLVWSYRILEAPKQPPQPFVHYDTGSMWCEEPLSAQVGGARR